MLIKIRDCILKSITNISDAHEFKPLLSEIETSPVSPLGRFTFWTVISLIIITIFWLYIGKVDIVINSRGIVIPDGEAKIIQPLDTGIVKNILVKEGDFVKKGQILVDLDSSTTSIELKSAEKNLSQANLEVQQLKAVAENGHFSPPKNKENQEEWQIQKDIYSQKLISLNKDINIKKLEISKIENQIKETQADKNTEITLLYSAKSRVRRLNNVVDVIAYNDYQKAIDDVKQHKENISKLSAEINKFESQKKQTSNEISRTKSDFKRENLEYLADTKQQMNQLEVDREEASFQNQKKKVIAPCDGYIDNLFIHTVGGVVTPAQKLVELTPVNKPLIIKAQVENRDIGFVKPGMPVSIKIDTFDFQKYGILDGRVKFISKNSINDEKLGPVYEIYITPITKTFIIDNKENNIATGMTLNAEINIGKRRIIDFFIYPLIKYMDEGINVR